MRLTILMILAALCVSVVSGGSILVGGPADGANCIPFDCPGSFGITHYQQLYAAADFSGPITINGLTFFDTVFDSAGTQSTGTFTVSLSTVSATVGTFSSLISVGGDNTQIFSGTIPSLAAGGSFTLGGGSFAYDPGSGSLLLDIAISGGADGGLFLDARSSATTIFARATNGSNTGTTGFGLVTQFDTGASTGAPEPSSISFGLLGIGALGGLALRRRA